MPAPGPVPEPDSPAHPQDRDVKHTRADAVRTLRSVVVASFAVLTAALLLTTVAGQIGSRWWPLELFANLPVQHAAAFGVLLGAGAALRSRPLIIASALGLAMNTAVAAPFLWQAYLTAPAPAASSASTLDVTFFNTKIIGADRQQTIDRLAQREDDAIVLAGGSEWWVDDFEATRTDLRIVAGPSQRRPELELIALSRAAGAAAQVHQLTDDPRDALVEIELELDGEPVRILAGNPVSPLTAERARQRDHMLTWIADWVQRQSVPVVVMGDLNVTPWSPQYRALVDATGLVDSLGGHGLQPSYPTLLGPFGIPIDHLLHSPELTTIERELGPALGSNHRMLHVQLAWTDTAAPVGRG